MKDTCPGDIKQTLRTNRSHVERKGKPQIGGEICSTCKVVGHLWRVDAKQGIRHELGGQQELQVLRRGTAGTHTDYPIARKREREESNNVQDVVRSCDMKARSSTEDWRCPRGLVTYLKFGKHWACSKPWKQKWISDTSRSRQKNGRLSQSHCK